MIERDDEATADEIRARDALRGLGAPGADAVFRSRLKAGFSAGSLAPVRRIVRGPWIARPSTWAPLAAAAGLAVVLALGNRAPDWRVAGSSGTGVVRVDGRVIALSDHAAIGAALARGAHVQMPEDGSLELVAPGQLAVSFSPEADVRLPQAPNRWWARRIRADVSMGDVFFATGGRFHGASLDVVTPEATAHVVGTRFAVLRQPHGTCVCVMEGRVRVRGALAAGDVVDVPAGLRRMCYDDSPSETGPILDYSVHHLMHLGRSASALLQR